MTKIRRRERNGGQVPDLVLGPQSVRETHNGAIRRRPNFLLLDKSATIPPKCSNLTINAGYLDYGRILITQQPDFAGVHAKNSMIPSATSDIHFV